MFQYRSNACPSHACMAERMPNAGPSHGLCMSNACTPHADHMPATCPPHARHMPTGMRSLCLPHVQPALHWLYGASWTSKAYLEHRQGPAWLVFRPRDPMAELSKRCAHGSAPNYTGGPSTHVSHVSCTLLLQLANIRSGCAVVLCLIEISRNLQAAPRW